MKKTLLLTLSVFVSLALSSQTKTYKDSNTGSVVQRLLINTNSNGEAKQALVVGTDTVWIETSGNSINLKADSLKFNGNVVDFGSADKISNIWNSSPSRNWIYPRTIADSVGVGTNSPNATLEVAGRVEISGTGQSVFIGENAGLNDDISNNRNVAIGMDALKANVSEAGNVAIGYNALVKYSGTSGHSGNVAIGYNSMKEAVSGSVLNTSVGNSSVNSLTTGTSNAVLGSSALYHNTEGSNNVAVGRVAGTYTNSGSSLSQADNSVFVGMWASANGVSETNQIVVGYQAKGNGSNTATIGDDNLTEIYMGENGQADLSAGSLKLANKSVHTDSIYTTVLDSDNALVTSGAVRDYVAGISSSGTVTNVSSANTNILTIANPTTTPVITPVTGSVSVSGTNICTSSTIYSEIHNWAQELKDFTAYAEGYIFEGSGLSVPIINTWYQVSGWTVGARNNVTTSTSSFTILSGYAGVYEISVNSSVSYSVSATTVKMAVFVGGVEQQNMVCEIYANHTRGQIFSIRGLADLSAGDVITLKIKADATGTFTNGFGNFNINRIAETPSYP